MLDGKAIKPLYEQLKEQIELAIAEGEYKPGEQLLPEVEMAKKYNVSVITVRKATSELSKKGILEKRQGKGTFVASRKFHKDLNVLQSFSETSRMFGAEPGAKVLASEIVVPSEEIIEQLELPPESRALYISRLRLLDDVPMVIENNYFPMKYSFLIDEDLNSQSLFRILKEKVGIEIARSKRTIEICRASTLEAMHLHVNKNSPLLLVQGQVYDQNSEIVYVGTQIINGERYKLNV